jgi:osmotically-inducible protein OsmY
MRLREALARGAERVRNWLNGHQGPPPDVAEEVRARLWGWPHLALDDVSCSFRAGVLTLRGCVGTAALRDIAEAVVRRVEGIERVVNEIEVVAEATEWQECERARALGRRTGPTSPAS